jgi:TetR/AcrR family transcriptional repressor of nem operon
MGYSQADKAETHSRVVAIAAKRIREAGLDGVSIADLMEEAGLTHGGFYKHFASRDALVAEAVGVALTDGHFPSKREGRERTFAEFIKVYLSEAHRDNPGASCAFSALMNDISRAPEEARTLYTEEARRSLGRLSSMLAADNDSDRRAEAILALSAMVGALGLARAVSDTDLSDEILMTVSETLIRDLPA